MNKKNQFGVVILSAVIITFLFHRQPPGLNVFIYEMLLIIWLIITKQINISGKIPIISITGLGSTAIFTVVTNSTFSLFINFVALFVFIGMLIYPKAKSLITATGLSYINFLKSQILFINEISGSKYRGQKLGTYLWKFRIFIIPVIIIILFVIIYRASNPMFDDLLKSTGIFIGEFVESIFNDFDFSIIFTFLIGLIISNYFIYRYAFQPFMARDLNSSDALIRRKTIIRKDFGINSLKNEYKAGVFLLLILNLILLILNVIDIYWVWFNFQWEGQYLKQFVHEGTYLLILSIIISIVLVLYYFRGNLNFYANNKLLKFLSYIWLGQNGILTISVAIRNFWYIYYFALAYKRIGVIIFLFLTIYGLFTVLSKVKYSKSAFYLFKTNALALYFILVISSAFNWDNIIAIYNFRHSGKSFVHLDYLATLSDNTLPVLDKSLPELLSIQKTQIEMFPFEKKYMTPDEYHQIIEKRKINFLQKWESQSFLSWNLPNYMAYKKIMGQKMPGQEK